MEHLVNRAYDLTLQQEFRVSGSLFTQQIKCYSTSVQTAHQVLKQVLQHNLPAISYLASRGLLRGLSKGHAGAEQQGKVS